MFLLTALLLLRVSHPLAKRRLSKTLWDVQATSRRSYVRGVDRIGRSTELLLLLLDWRVLLLVEVHAWDGVNLVTPNVEHHRFALTLSYALSKACILQVSGTQGRVIGGSGILEAVSLLAPTFVGVSAALSHLLRSKSRHYVVQFFGRLLWRRRSLAPLERHHLFLVVYADRLVTILAFTLTLEQRIGEIECFLGQICRGVGLLQVDGRR